MLYTMFDVAILYLELSDNFLIPERILNKVEAFKGLLKSCSYDVDLRS